MEIGVPQTARERKLESTRGAWKAICESKLVSSVRNRRTRRTLVLGFLAVLGAMPLVGWQTNQPWLVLVLLIPFAMGSVLLAASTYGILDRPIRVLDEREQQVRRRIFVEPYVTGATVGLGGGLVLAAGLSADEALLLGVMISVISFIFLLPSMVLAWRLADETSHDG